MRGSLPLVGASSGELPSLGRGLSGIGSVSGLGQPDLAAGPNDFAATLAELVRESVQTVVKGEAVALAGMDGKASVQQVVEAVMHAEQTLSTMVAVRDKVVGAYLEISRMQI